MPKKGSNLTGVAIVLIIGIAALVYLGQGTTINRIGLGLTLHYVDGTSRTVYSPTFADIKSLDTTVWDGTEQISSIDAFMLMQNSITASTFTYSCAYEVQIDGTVQRSGTVDQNVGSVSAVNTVALTSVSSSEILGWTGLNNGTHLFGVNVPAGSTLTAQTSEGSKLFTYNGQLVTLSLTNLESGPPNNTPPTGTSITLYTYVWSSASSGWVPQNGVAVTVSYWAGVSSPVGTPTLSTWTTNAQGYITMNVTAGTYSFSATYSSYTNSTSITIASGEQLSVKLYFGISVSPPPGNYVFQDGFESGSFSAWTGTQFTSGTGVVDAGAAHSGSYGARFATQATTGYLSAFASKAITPASTLYARGYFRLSTIPFTTQSDRVYLILFDSGAGAVAYAGIDRLYSGAVCWQLLCMNGTSYATVTDTTRTVSAGQWYSVELYWFNSASGGSARLYINGVLSCQVSGINTSGYGNAQYIRFGIPQKAGSAFAIEVCADDCVVNTNYIGP